METLGDIIKSNYDFLTDFFHASSSYTSDKAESICLRTAPLISQYVLNQVLEALVKKYTPNMTDKSNMCTAIASSYVAVKTEYEVDFLVNVSCLVLKEIVRVHKDTYDEMEKDNAIG